MWSQMGADTHKPATWALNAGEQRHYCSDPASRQPFALLQHKPLHHPSHTC